MLAGGTGLALRLGRRLSEDFDFFRTEGMETNSIFRALGVLGECETLRSSERTLTLLVSGVKMSFFQIDDPFLHTGEEYSFFCVADTRDIALMKLRALTNRGSRKDFVDLYTILRSAPVLRGYLDLLPHEIREGQAEPVPSAAWADLLRGRRGPGCSSLSTGKTARPFLFERLGVVLPP
jgi:hypothetical protein